MPYPFYSPNDSQWSDFAEDCVNGPTTNFLKNVRKCLINAPLILHISNDKFSTKYSQLAKKFRMIIISPILEREGSKFYNTSVIIASSGEVIGKYRKNHIPPIEATFLSSGDFNHNVWDTEFGKIGIMICYERHFPLNWMILGMKGAEIIFNPSAEDENSLSERMWTVEGRNAAVANGFFTVNINRAGSEEFSSGVVTKYFGSTYSASPNGFVSKSLPKEGDGLLISEIDLNACRRAKEEFSFHRNQNLNKYMEEMSKKTVDNSALTM